MARSKIAIELDEARDRIADLEYVLANVSAVEAGCSHISIEWREIGGIRIGLDASGDAVRVEFPERLYGWDAE